MFTRVKFVWIPAASIVTSTVLPWYKIAVKVTKHIKGCYCPITYIRTLVTTTIDARYEKNGLVLFSTFFFAEYIMPHIFHTLCNDVSTTLWCFQNLEKWSLYLTSKPRKVGQDHSGETNVQREIICVHHNFDLGGREFVALFFNGIPVDETKWRSSARNVEICFRTPSQFRQFVVEVGLILWMQKNGGRVWEVLSSFSYSESV